MKNYETKIKTALQTIINSEKDKRVFLCGESFILFAMYYFPHYFKYKPAEYHYQMSRDLMDLMEGKLRECLWVMYRESAKTTFAKLFVIWLICYKERRYINVDSFDKENAERILFDVVFELANNQSLQQDFGVLFSREKKLSDIKQNRINNFVTENGIRVEAHSTQESVRGRLHLDQRPDFLLLDDFETNKTKDSDAYTKQVREHITEAMAGLAPNGVILYLGNYITEYGNIQFLLDRAVEDQKIRIRNVPVVIGTRPAWPDKYCMTDEESESTGKVSVEDKKRQLGSYVFSYEMMNNPIDDSIAEFKREFIQNATEDDLKHLRYTTYITIDTAVSEKDSADFTGIVVNRVTSDNKWYVTAYKLKVNPKDLIEHLFYINDMYKPRLIGIEKTVYLLSIKPFLDEEMRRRNTFLSIRELDHKQTQKETRIRGIIPRWESRSILLVGNCDALLDEMRVFPRGQHDDVLDAFAYQEQIAFPLAQEVEEIEEESVLYPDINI